MFAAGELLRRVFGVATEYTRKLAHVGGGLVVLSAPWTVTSHWTLLALCAAFFGMLLLGRVTGALGSVHGVERSTGGAWLYPVAVYVTWLLAEGDTALYCVSMGVMVFADASAAIVGRHVGDTPYRVMDGIRSAEGSLSFFAVAFAVCFVGLGVAGGGSWAEIALIALVTAVMTACTEAISVRGVDNLLVPWAALVVIRDMRALGLAQMDRWLVGLLVTLACVAAVRRATRLRPAGGIAAFLFGALAWGLGGPVWFVPLAVTGLVLLFVHAGFGVDADLEQVFPAVVGSVLTVAVLAHVPGHGMFVPFVGTLSANAAIGLYLATQAEPSQGVLLRARSAGAAGLAAAAPAFAAWTVEPEVPAALTTAAGLVGLLLFAGMQGARWPGRRLAASGAIGAGMWLVSRGWS